jgi:hypothetical protein
LNTETTPTEFLPLSLRHPLYRSSFAAFCYGSFEVVNPGQSLISNWHIEAACHAIEQMVRGESTARLVLNLPPRTLKSYIASVCLPAWVLGGNPGARIICASYSEDLAHKFSRDCRALMESPFYKRIFPGARLNPKKSTETEFETTRRGYQPLSCTTYKLWLGTMCLEVRYAKGRIHVADR